MSGAVRKKVQSISGFLTDVDVDVSQRICIVIFCGLTKRMRMTISSTTLWLGYGRMIKSNCSDGMVGLSTHGLLLADLPPLSRSRWMVQARNVLRHIQLSK